MISTVPVPQHMPLPPLPPLDAPESKLESPIALAIRQELQKLLEKPFSLTTARKVQRLVGSGIKVLQATAEGVENMPKRRRGGYAMAYGNSNSDDDGDEGGAMGDYAVGYNPVMSSGPENFGTTAVRELMGMLPKLLEAKKKANADPEALVNAYDAAKKAGLDTIADNLKKQLEEATKPDEPAPTRGMSPVPVGFRQVPAPHLLAHTDTCSACLSGGACSTLLELLNKPAVDPAASAPVQAQANEVPFAERPF